MNNEEWKDIKHFTPDEFSDPFKMDYNFLLLLDSAREKAGIPFELNSTYREGDPLSHGRGFATDIKCTTSNARFKIVTSLLSVGFTRIGVYDKHIHVDHDPSLPKNVMWWGTSK